MLLPIAEIEMLLAETKHEDIMEETTSTDRNPTKQTLKKKDLLLS